MNEQEKIEYRGFHYWFDECHNQWSCEFYRGCASGKEFTESDCKEHIDRGIENREKENVEVAAMLVEIKECILAVTEYDKLSVDNGKLAIQAAIKAGEKLARCKYGRYGSWESWVNDNLQISVDTADRYIKLFNSSRTCAAIAECTSLRQAYIAAGIIKNKPKQEVPVAPAETSEQAAETDGEPADAIQEHIASEVDESLKEEMIVAEQLTEIGKACEKLVKLLIACNEENASKAFKLINPIVGWHQDRLANSEKRLSSLNDGFDANESNHGQEITVIE